ncbi:uncharacterized protein LOC121530064 [Drosophila eugracilis]|uniref:uncharacterized protein LOC121530064 n=1 Tax=Drosophila eugracilis TaxID=29029 RepID=UPI001BD932B4|nr:uncharacterized protein LOC121530064 [Drosophila eugracilis]
MKPIQIVFKLQKTFIRTTCFKEDLGMKMSPLITAQAQPVSIGQRIYRYIKIMLFMLKHHQMYIKSTQTKGKALPENYSINKDPTSPNVEEFYKNEGIFRRTEFQNNASNPQASLNAYQNNTNQSRVLPENYFIKNDPTPANVEVRCKDEIISRRSEYDYPIEISDRKSQPYGNQESFNESSSYANHTQVHSTYPIDDYNNQSLRQSFNRPCINAQCNINNPQIEIFQGNAFERKPITDSAYSQGSKGTTNSGRQSHREMVAFPNSETIDPESYTLNDNNVSNIERNAQVPLQICDNSNCPHLTGQYYPMSNNSQSYQTEIDFPEANPDGDSVSCKGPEFCPYKGMYKPDVGPNNRGVVTFQDSDRPTLSRDRNRQQPAQRSWENPIYPMSKRVISYRKMNGLTRCNPDCYCNQKEIPFQKGGTAHNYDNFVRNPYCPENNIVNGNINRTGRCRNRNCPEKESFHSNGKSSYQQDFAEGSGRQENPSEWGGRCRTRENYNYSENKLYYNGPLNQSINQSYQNVGSQSNYNFSTMFPNQDDKSRTGPRITVVKCHQKSEEKVIKSNPNKESFQATSECERFHRFSNKENINNNSRLIKGCIKPSQMYKNQPNLIYIKIPIKTKRMRSKIALMIPQDYTQKCKRMKLWHIHMLNDFLIKDLLPIKSIEISNQIML